MRAISRCAAVLAVVAAGFVVVGHRAGAETRATGTLQLLVEPQAGMGPIDQYLRGPATAWTLRCTSSRTRSSSRSSPPTPPAASGSG